MKQLEIRLRTLALWRSRILTVLCGTLCGVNRRKLGKAVMNGRISMDEVAITRCLLFLMLTAFVAGACSDPQAPIITPPQPHVQQDTTSHEVEWTVYSFGPGIPSSTLQDIIAFAPDDVWAVGEFYDDAPDSTGRLGKPYNALHWNGSVWEKLRIIGGGCNRGLLGVSPLWAIAGERDNFLVCNSSGAAALFNGKDFVPLCMRVDSAVTWGAASEDMFYVSDREWYVVGNNLGKGEVTLGQPPNYTRIAHIDVLPINKVASDGRGNVWACGFDYQGHASFMRITRDHEVIDLRKDFKYKGLYKFEGLSALWISKDSLYGAFGSALYIQALYDTSHFRFLSALGIDPSIGVKWRIDGTADNDVFMVGSFASVVHYNGKSLHYYPDIDRRVGGGDILGVDATEDYIYLCGRSGSTHAFVAIGKRRK